MGKPDDNATAHTNHGDNSKPLPPPPPYSSISKRKDSYTYVNTDEEDNDTSDGQSWIDAEENAYMMQDGAKPGRQDSKARSTKRKALLWLGVALFCAMITIAWSPWRFKMEYWQEQDYSGFIPVDADDVTVEKKTPDFPYTQLLTLSRNVVPAKSGPYSDRRLAFIGDVHGCIDEFKALLKKVHSRRHKTHIVLAGDLVTKGPHSLQVLDLASKIRASCVRGNHDDELLQIYHSLQKHRSNSDPSALENYLQSISTSTKHAQQALQIAQKMTKHQAEYLDSCPLMIKANPAGLGEIVCVHAGILPGIHLLDQDPNVVMNMRTINPKTNKPSAKRNGKPWTTVWNHYQEHHNRAHGRPTTTVIYGHDAKLGLNVKEYSRGLDTNCARGGKLTALVVQGGRNPTEYLQSVKCRKYAD